ncbi:MAG: nucleotidyltransferase [Desulfuromonadales bacterium]|nr:nucleotidyltransferase [Desulfuromonadales bacterium]MBN2792621.1 nucleotidyltransferase [Desulfuromonadales bacterium]
MKTVGLITEYNPFHNGHLYHLEESLEQSEADVAVAVMSGHFLQRGEPALVDKWVRAKMALSGGVDVVIELPLPWACSSAPDFARGGIQALNALGAVTSVCFGSESGQLETLQTYADLLVDEAEAIDGKTAILLRRGVNYPQARTQVVADLLPSGDVQAISTPNNILGVEYLKALRQAGSAIVPLTVKRLGAGYHDSCVGEGRMASATGIRQRLKKGEDVDVLMPKRVHEVLLKTLKAGHFLAEERFFSLLLTRIFSQSFELERFWLVDNGMEKRLLAYADQAGDLETLISGIKSRQLTRTRIQRMLIAVLLGLERTQVEELLSAEPKYLHLLAVSEKGRNFLSRSRKQRTIPLIQNFSRVYPTLKRCYGVGSDEYRLALTQLELETRATRMYSLLLHGWEGNSRNRDYYQPLIGAE